MRRGNKLKHKLLNTMKINLLLVMTLSLVCFACQSAKDCCSFPSNYLPLQVGNYWKVNDEDYVEIVGKVQLNDGEYFELYSFIKDVPDRSFQTRSIYLRIDDKQNLIQGYKNNNFTNIIVNFNMREGDELDNVDKVTVLEKNSEKMRFRHNCLVCSFTPSFHESTFLNGHGFAERNFFLASNFGLIRPFKEVKINGVVYKL